MRNTIALLALLALAFSAHAQEPTLREGRFKPLPLGAVKPAGWLRDQLTVQANGLTGHLGDFWKDVGPDSAWRGGAGEGWERGPYYLDGLIPLAYLLDDPALIAKTKPFVEYMLASGQPNGWFGPAKNKDRWPLAIALKVLTQYHEATGDERALNIIKRYVDYLNAAPPDWPDRDWRGVRAGENVLTAFWLYRRTNDPAALRAAQKIIANSFNWSQYFVDMPFKDKVPGNKGHTSHVVNVAMAVKYPGLRYQLSGLDTDRDAAFKALENLDRYHGQAAGRFGGDEHLAGRHPSQGTELCAVVEEMFSLAHLSAIFADARFADRTEVLAYNALPGTCTPDFWAHQYDQQANQVLVSISRRMWTTNGPDSNLYGLEPNFGCCTSNMHQGWPKLVSHMWMSTNDGGLAAIVYGPSTVSTKLANDTAVTITEQTDYPFDGTIRFTLRLSKPAEFPLALRIPAWAAGRAQLTAANQPVQAGSNPGWVTLRRPWNDGDIVELKLPMDLRTESRFNNAVAIQRGPLYFSLKIGERFEKLRAHHATLPTADWAIHPTTPWNYGLIVDRDNPAQSITVETRKPAQVPFANDAAPIILKVKGKLLPDWKLVRDSADTPPASPAPTTEPAVDLTLLPYGSTRLRITEFPTVNP